MAVNLDAILRVAARVSGQQDVRNLGRDMENVGVSAQRAGRGVQAMSAQMRTLQQIATTLGFAGLVAGLTMFIGKTVQAGETSNLLQRRMESTAGQFNETGKMFDFASKAAKQFGMSQLEAREKVVNLYSGMRPLGLSAEQIQTTFLGVTKAVRLAGLSGLDAKEAFRQLGQAIGSGRLQGDEFRSLMERIPILGTKMVEVFNNLRRQGGLTLITREQADQMVAEVKNGEVKQTEALKEGIRQRKEALERSNNSQLDEVARHYARLRQIASDSYSDQDRNESEARNNQLDREKEAIEDRYNQQRKALDREFEDRQAAISRDESISDQEKTNLSRSLQDQQEIRREALQKQEEAEVGAARRASEEAALVRERALRDERQKAEYELADQQKAREDELKRGYEQQQRDLDAHLQKTIDQNKAANDQVIAGIIARIQVTRGDLKKMASEGVLDPNIITLTLKEMEKMKVPEPTAIMKYKAAFEDLTLAIGDKLLPKLTPLIERITQLLGDAKFQDSLSQLIRNVAEVLIPAIKPLIEILNSILQVFASIPPGLRDALIKVGVLVGLFRVLGGGEILKGLGSLAGGLSGIMQAATGAGRALETIPKGTGALKGLGGYSGPVMPGSKLDLNMSGAKPPPPTFWNSFLSGIRNVMTGLGGITGKLGEIGVSLATTFAGTRMATTIAGWLGALGPFSARAIGLLAPLLTWVTGTMLPTLIGVFSGPAGWIVLGVAALATLAVAFREPIVKFISGAVDSFGQFWQKVLTLFYEKTLEPWVNIWNSDLLEPIRAGLSSWLLSIAEWWGKVKSKAFEFISSTWNGIWDGSLRDSIVKGVQKWMVEVKKFFNGIISWLYDPNGWGGKWGDFWEVLVTRLQLWFQRIPDSFIKAWQYVSGTVQNVFDSVARAVQRTWTYMSDGILNRLNGIVQIYNSIASKVNGLPGNVFNFPILSPFVTSGNVATEQFATGGFVTKPTLAWVGEGRPGGEYAIPADQMPAAMTGWAQGLRGQALIEHSRRAPSAAPAGAGAPEISITLQQRGPTLQTPDGAQWISREEAVALLEQGMAAQARALLPATASMMRSAAARSAWGLS